MADVVENLNNAAKEVFGTDGVPDLVPNSTKFQKSVPFSKSEKLGLKFVQTVRLAYPTGFTHAKGDGTAGAFSFMDATKGNISRAELLGSQILLRDQMSYEDAQKLTGSREAFKEGSSIFFEGMQKSMRKRIEGSVVYGGSGIGTISGSPTTSGSNKIITITTSEWAPGIWMGTEGMQFDCYNGGSQINTNAALVVVTVDPVARTVTASGNATDLGNLANGYTLYWRGAKGNEMTGIHGIVTNTGSLFNIDASVYSLWKTTQYAPTSGALTFQKVKKGIALAVAKGLDEGLELHLNPSTWDDLNSDIAALRKTDDKDVKRVDIGSEEIVYHSQNGETKLVPNVFVKEGYTYGLCNPKEYWKRVGAADATFNVPGFSGEMFLHLPSAAGVESRIYSHQAVMSLAPGKQLYISGIVNTSY